MAMLPPMLQCFTDEGSGGKKSPCGAARSLMCAVIAPGWTVAIAETGSISIWSQWSRWMTQPPLIGAQAPVVPVPRPRTVTGTRCSLASFSVAPMSSSFAGRMTASGMKESRRLSNDAAKQDASSVRTTSGPSFARRAWVAAGCVWAGRLTPPIKQA